MCSNEGSRQVLESYFELAHAVRTKTRSYNALLSDFQNLTEQYDRARKAHVAEAERREAAQRAMTQAEESARLVQQRYDEKEQEVRTAEARLKDARGEVARQVGYISALEADRDELENRLEMIKRNLEKQLVTMPENSSEQLAFMRQPSVYRSHSRAYAARFDTMVEERASEQTEEDSVDYDETEEESVMEEEKREEAKRRSSIVASVPLIRQPALAAHRVAQSRARVAGNGERTSGMQQQTRVSGQPTTTTSTKVTTTIKVDEQQQRLQTTVSIRTSSGTPRMRKSYSINQRPHRFEEYTGITKKCAVCALGFLFRGKAAVRCVDCGQHAHDKCKGKLACPCVPQAATPSRSRLPANTKFGLHEFCPASAPMIAVPIVRCVVALENKGLQTEGVYRRSGNKALITKALVVLCHKKEVPRLEVQDSEVLTGCIRNFLSPAYLRDPLIPKTSRDEFVRAAVTGKAEALQRAIVDLPQPNRDTLAYLCVHWLKVIALSAVNRMTMDNLCRCIAPTVVGMHNHASLATADDDLKDAVRVLETLLLLDTSYWKQYLQMEEPRKSVGAPRTAPSTPARKFGLNSSKRWR
ncbi:hypothetical protein PFISCL1PPCAC_16806 [Pristionchus fissidentatus]|uniref:Uncharacterized protein n=1 Tax=Pristionchus fissidentatus TaxID=1538716 RepID=A0AAV5W6K6_9BILA|nr:hypothetical protein PFISCL1PPCAC_16806 [Pristionchus fissidentatus]